MVLGMVSTNCYLVYNDDTKEGVVVDPADNGCNTGGSAFNTWTF